MRFGRWLGAVATAMLAVGCGGGGGDGKDAEPTMVGTWRADGDGYGLFTPKYSIWTKALELHEDGTGFVLLENWSVGSQDRVEVGWWRENATGILRIQSDRLGGRAFDIRWEWEGERAVLIDHDGAELPFDRYADAMSSIEIANLTPIEPVLSTPIHPMSELVTRGATSWFEIYGHKIVNLDGLIVPMDAVYSHPIAAQGDDLWMACEPCETPTKIQRRTMANALVSEIELAPRILTPLTAGYYDASSLWIATDTTVPGDTDDHSELWRFDPEEGITAPSSDRKNFAVTIETFTFHQGRLLVIVSQPTQVLVEIGATQTRSWELPEDIRWQGLASAGNAVRILGAGENEYPVIAEVTNL